MILGSIGLLPKSEIPDGHGLSLFKLRFHWSDGQLGSIASVDEEVIVRQGFPNSIAEILKHFTSF